jgi:hypothetical protein
VVTCGVVQALLSSKHLPVQHTDDVLLWLKEGCETLKRSDHCTASGDSSQRTEQFATAP